MLLCAISGRAENNATKIDVLLKKEKKKKKKRTVDGVNLFIIF